MEPDLISTLFAANVACQVVSLLGVVASIAFPRRRVYPMSGRNAAFYVLWIAWAYILGSNLALMVLDWNTGPWSSPLRLYLGIPIAALGLSFFLWAITTLGLKNTSAIRDRFVAAGPYLLSRNPQYVGDLLMFVGLSIVANSELVWIVHMLTALTFLLSPLAEEPWLVEQYGETYEAYRREVPRYL